MRIVQTFWTAGRDPLQYSFGWLHPEYNLMSWALSCLSLRKHYDEVALYTDEQGKHVLIDLLHLPYTEVHVVYDEHLCLPQHWAYAKIKTYSLQDKPFLHVDGDVYLPKPIPDEIINAPLIAQNREIGTRYYRNIVDKITSWHGMVLPDFVTEELKKDPIPSYNMGIFGGNDLEFIHKYCESSLLHFGRNGKICDNGNLNILLEQICFAILCDKESKRVSCLIDKMINDNGYTVNDFCSLNRYQNKKIFHILGGHKRRNEVISSLPRRLLLDDRECFLRIANLFPYRYVRVCFDEELAMLVPQNLECISEYTKLVENAESDWKDVDVKDLMITEERIASSQDLLLSDINKFLTMDIYVNSFCKFFDIPDTWNESTKDTLRRYLKIDDKEIPLCHLGIIPTVFSELRRHIILQALDNEIIKLVGTKVMCIKDVVNSVMSARQERDRSGCYYHTLTEIKYLIKNGILIISLKN